MQLKNKTSHLYKVDEIMKTTEVKKANVHQVEMSTNEQPFDNSQHDAKLPVISSAIDAYPYNGSNGIIICCRSCGREIEETDGGFYSPVQFENEKFERQCSQCRDM